MFNTIQDIRDALQFQFNTKVSPPVYHYEELSPCGRYRLTIDEFAVKENQTISEFVVATVLLREANEVVTTFLRNDSRLFYAWITRNDHDYLLFPEDLEGQSIVDLTTRRIAGFADNEGGFIWTEFHPSPDKAKLAVIGCFWACPYQVVVYDFRDPMDVPLKVMAEIDLPGNNAQFGQWTSNESFTMIDRQGVSHVFQVPKE